MSSWHEIGLYDLPAMIDFILLMTNQEQLSYVGHSQGTTSFFVMASMRPDYNKKIKLMVALAPVVYMDHMRNPLMQLLAHVHDPIKVIYSNISVPVLIFWTSQLILNILGWHEFLPGEKLLNLIGRKICSRKAPVRAICASVFFMICGWDSQQLNKVCVS